jgi:hypothetical protein
VHEHVRRVDEAAEHLAAVRGPEVEHESELVAVDRVERPALAVDVVDAAPLVALRRLDLHQVRAELGEVHRGERAAQVVGQVDDPHAGEEPGGAHRPASAYTAPSSG